MTATACSQNPAPSGARDRFSSFPPIITLFGKLTSTPIGVRMRVVNKPICCTVPSAPPTRTTSPTLNVREYSSVNPPAACPTMLEAPIDTIRPTNRLRPLNASVSAPGR